MIDISTTSIEFLKGVGPARALLLQKELGIYTYEDMLMYFPFRHLDRSSHTPIAQVSTSDPYVVVRGYVSNMQTVTSGRNVRLTAQLHDATGVMELVWFQGVKWIRESLKPNLEYIVMGKPARYGSVVQIAHPDMEPVSMNAEVENHAFLPVYSSTEKLKAKGINSKLVSKLMDTLLRLVEGQIPETLPPGLLSHFRLPSRAEAIRMMHFPTSHDEAFRAMQRFKFEELFFLQLDYQHARVMRQQLSVGRIFGVVGEKFNEFYSQHLPFSLTGAQKRVIKEIRADMRSGHQMNRLLQGDVGSGKTLVSLLCILIALDNGCQSCLMAPTEILASQHYASFCRMLDGMDVHVALLTGSLKTAEKKRIKRQLAEGEIDILIGTHALIEDDVVFKDLGFVVIDEQHRFGVEQRSKLWTKSSVPPHVLVMTATPIPRTLAMTLYGDLDCSVIDELPPGRRPIQTIHGTDADRLRLFAFMKQQIALGRQVYVVYPLINESEKLDLKDLMDGYESISRDFPMPDYQLAIVHGQMSAEAKAYEMERFKSGVAQIMVSTTVIEVGVDVPNATVMVIENAERFGLSQLHQLRGRVGRGGEQSYCVLMTKADLSHTGKERIRTMVNSSDGFKIAEADLRLRGPGDIQGLQQSGVLDLKLADIVDDEPIVKAARDVVARILEADPQLLQPENRPLNLYIKKKRKGPSWDRIS
ncbi:MAG: ATP-dependent DNA helicase RecG [Bacteroidales bacterium]|nr:ATP-dependent DNA helicase RecG [Bacteroidales bacterium]